MSEGRLKESSGQYDEIHFWSGQSPWYDECVGKEYGDFMFTFGTMDCGDINLVSVKHLENRR